MVCFYTAHSAVFADLLVKSSEVLIEGFGMSGLEIDAFLEFIYTGLVVSKDLNVLRKLVKLAKEFKIFSLKDQCVHQTILKLSDAKSETYLDYYKLGMEFDSAVLLKKAAGILER